MAEHEVWIPSTYWVHESIDRLLVLWSCRVAEQSAVLARMRTEPDTPDDALIDLDYQIEEIDSILRQLEPLIGA